MTFTRTTRQPDTGRSRTRRGGTSRLRRWPYWAAASFIAVTCALWVYPFVWMVSASLKDQLEIFAAGLRMVPETFEWGNYQRAWIEADFGLYVFNTVIVTVATVVLVVIRCALAGYVLGRYRFRGRKLIIGLLVATLFVPVGYAIIPIVDITQRLGLLNSRAGIIIALTGLGHVPMVLLYAGYFRKIPRELEEAAVIDGAGFLSIFFRVMFPLAKPVTATATLLTFLATWNAFFLPLVFTFSRPELRTVSVGMLAFVGENSVDWSGMTAAATISLLPVVLLFIFLQRYFVEGIAGAVKS